MRTIIIDCDPGLDDAVALLLAVASPELEIEAVTVVAGNVALDRTAMNARAILDHVGSTVPVFAGCPRPIAVEPYYAAYIHGASGLQDLELATPTRAIEPRHAVDVLTASLEAAEPRSAWICALGPLTNIAAVLIQRPDLERKIARLTVMGGAIGVGNTTPAAEFNIFVDPHAADRVMKADIPITLIPLDVTETVVMDRWRLSGLKGRTDAIGELAARIMDRPHPQPRWGERGIPIHDACVIGHVLWPDLFEGDNYSLQVDTTDGCSRGRTVIDLWHKFRDRPRKIHVLTNVDVDALLTRIVSALDAAPPE